MSAANVYPSNGLFRKMWEKQLAAVVTEAIGEKPRRSAAPQRRRRRRPQRPSSSPRPRRASPTSATLAAGMRQEVRDADKSLYNEARGADGKWIHRSYLAK